MRAHERTHLAPATEEINLRRLGAGPDCVAHPLGNYEAFARGTQRQVGRGARPSAGGRESAAAHVSHIRNVSVIRRAGLTSRW